jgi:hypothetical protein
MATIGLALVSVGGGRGDGHLSRVAERELAAVSESRVRTTLRALTLTRRSRQAGGVTTPAHVFALVETKVGHRVRFVKLDPCDRYRIEIGGIRKHPFRRGAAVKARPKNGRPWVSKPARGR